MRRKFHFLLFLLIGLPVFVAGQQTALKTNAFFWATTTPNIGVEVGISQDRKSTRLNSSQSGESGGAAGGC